MSAGSAANAIPDEGVVEGTVRCLDAEVWRSAVALIEELVQSVAMPYGVTAKVEYLSAVPPTVNEAASAALIASAAAAMLGPDAVTETAQSLGGEDFAWYLDVRAGRHGQARHPHAGHAHRRGPAPADLRHRRAGDRRRRPRAGVCRLSGTRAAASGRRAAVNEDADEKDPDDREVFRSTGAVIVWWVWVLFAVGNLIDLAVQGRDHLTLVAAFILLFVTGIVYTTAQRPRIVADADGLTIVNPLRDHRVGWAAVAGADPTDLLRVRCEWPDGDGTARRAIYSWAVHSSRRRQVVAEMRAQRRPTGAAAALAVPAASGFGRGLADGPAAPAPAGDPLRVDAGRVVAALTERAEKARLDAPDAQATAPVSTWDLTALAAIVIPGLALLIIALPNGAQSPQSPALWQSPRSFDSGPGAPGVTSVGGLDGLARSQSM